VSRRQTKGDWKDAFKVSTGKLGGLLHCRKAYKRKKRKSTRGHGGRTGSPNRGISKSKMKEKHKRRLEGGLAVDQIRGKSYKEYPFLSIAESGAFRRRDRGEEISDLNARHTWPEEKILEVRSSKRGGSFNWRGHLVFRKSTEIDYQQHKD